MQDLGVNYSRQGGITFLGMHVFVLCCPGGAVLGLDTLLSHAPDSTGIYVGSVG